MCSWKDRCTCRPIPGQEALFDHPPTFQRTNTVGRMNSSPTSQRETNLLGHEGFQYDACPQVFLNRRGIGPLIVSPDTCVLIDLLNGGEAIDGLAFGFGSEGPLEFGPLLDGDWTSRRDAIDDLMRLWFWRDIRFFVSDIYVNDSKKPLPDRVGAAANRSQLLCHRHLDARWI